MAPGAEALPQAAKGVEAKLPEIRTHTEQKIGTVLNGILEDDQVVMPAAEKEKLADALKDVGGIASDYKNVALNKVAKTLRDMAQNIPAVAVDEGRMRLAIGGKSELTCGNSSPDYVGTSHTSGKFNVNTILSIEPLQLKVATELVSAPERGNMAEIMTAVLQQLASGISKTGATAPGMVTMAEEDSVKAYIETGSVCTPQAAACVVLVSIFGWILHMTPTSFDIAAQRSNRTLRHWRELEQDWAIWGHASDQITSGVSSDVAFELGLGRHYANANIGEIHVRVGGHLVRVATYAQTALRDSTQVDETEAPRSGRYLLAMPEIEQASDRSVQAFAAALTAGKPDVDTAVGHGQLMAAASSCNVGFISGVLGVGSTPDDYLDTTTFGVEDAYTLFGYVYRRYFPGEVSTVDRVMQQIGSMFQASATTHHDFTNTLCARLPKIPHPFCEPAVVKGMKSRGTIDAPRITKQQDNANGRNLARTLVNYTVMAVIARANLETKIVGRMPQVLYDNDVATLQSDRHAIVDTLAQEAASNDNLFDKICSRLKTVGEVPMAAIFAAGQGIQAAEAVLPDEIYPITLGYNKPGCYYIRNGGDALTRFGIESWDFDHHALSEYVSVQPGTVTNSDCTGRVATPDSSTAVVIDALGSHIWRHMGNVDNTGDHQTDATNCARAIIKNMAATKIVATNEQPSLDDDELAAYIDWLASGDAEADIVRRQMGSNWTGIAPPAMDQWPVLTRRMLVRMRNRRHPLGLHGEATITDTASVHSLEFAGVSRAKAKLTHQAIATVKRSLIAFEYGGFGMPEAEHKMGLRQAVAYGWWQGSTTRPLAMHMHYTNGGVKTDVLSVANGTAFMTNDDKIAPCSKVSFISHVLSHLGLAMGCTTLSGLYSTLGTSIVGGGAVPAPVVYWHPTVIACDFEDTTPEILDIAALLAQYTNSQDPLNLRLAAANVNVPHWVTIGGMAKSAMMAGAVNTAGTWGPQGIQASSGRLSRMIGQPGLTDYKQPTAISQAYGFKAIRPSDILGASAMVTRILRNMPPQPGSAGTKSPAPGVSGSTTPQPPEPSTQGEPSGSGKGKGKEIPAMSGGLAG